MHGDARCSLLYEKLEVQGQGPAVVYTSSASTKCTKSALFDWFSMNPVAKWISAVDYSRTPIHTYST